MADFVRGNVLTLDDGTKFVVVDSFFKNNKHYLYIISEDDGKTTMIVEYKDGDITEIEDKIESAMVYRELIERNKEEIEKYMEEIDEN